MNHRAVLDCEVSPAPRLVAAAATVRARLAGAPSRSSFQRIAQPPASADPTPGKVRARPVAATAIGRPTSVA